MWILIGLCLSLVILCGFFDFTDNKKVEYLIGLNVLFAGIQAIVVATTLVHQSREILENRQLIQNQRTEDEANKKYDALMLTFGAIQNQLSLMHNIQQNLDDYYKSKKPGDSIPHILMPEDYLRIPFHLIPFIAVGGMNSLYFELRRAETQFQLVQATITKLNAVKDGTHTTQIPQGYVESLQAGLFKLAPDALRFIITQSNALADYINKHFPDKPQIAKITIIEKAA
jgi:hypothetical protein